MNTINLKGRPDKLLLAASIFYLVCGVSGLVAPSTWLTLSNIDTNQPALVYLLIQLLGGYLLALAVIAALAIVLKQSGLVAVWGIFVANFLDLICVLLGFNSGALSGSSTLAFGVVDLAWVLATSIWLRQFYRATVLKE